jgi:hypothetical protein
MNHTSRRRYLIPTPILAVVALIAFLILVLTPPPAHADEPTPTDPAATTATVDVTPQAETPAAEPVVLEQPAEVPATDPVPDPEATDPVATVETPAVPEVHSLTSEKQKVSYVTVAWQMPSYVDASTATWPQTILGTVPTKKPKLNAADDFLAQAKCGTGVQFDVYVAGTVSDALIAGGHLDGPNNPPEALIDGGWGVAYKVAASRPCVTTQVCETTSSVLTTNLAGSPWTWSDTRATGHRALTAGGLHIWTEGATSTDKVAGYYPTSFPLSGVGSQSVADSIDYAATTGITPGLQLVVDIDGDGAGDGILVGEQVYGGYDWWLTNSATAAFKAGAPETGGGFGSAFHGTINGWLTSFEHATVVAVGFSLGSGVLGDGVLHSITLGCVNYTFDLPALPAATVEHRTDRVAICDGTATEQDYSRTTEYVRDGDGQPVLGTPGAWVKVGEPRQVTATAEEIAALDCPVTIVTPPPAPPAVQLSTPVGTLPFTGVEDQAIIVLSVTAGALLLFGLLVLIIAKVRGREPRYRRNKQTPSK